MGDYDSRQFPVGDAFDDSEYREALWRLGTSKIKWRLDQVTLAISASVDGPGKKRVNPRPRVRKLLSVLLRQFQVRSEDLEPMHGAGKFDDQMFRLLPQSEAIRSTRLTEPQIDRGLRELEAAGVIRRRYVFCDGRRSTRKVRLEPLVLLAFLSRVERKGDANGVAVVKVAPSGVKKKGGAAELRPCNVAEYILEDSPDRLSGSSVGLGVRWGKECFAFFNRPGWGKRTESINVLSRPTAGGRGRGRPPAGAAASAPSIAGQILSRYPGLGCDVRLSGGAGGAWYRTPGGCPCVRRNS